MRNPLTYLSIMLLAALSAAHADQMPAYGQQPQGPGGHRTPPPEAFEACDGKQAGDVVSFTTPRGEKLTGTCKMYPARLVAMPDHPPQGGNGGNGGGTPPSGQPSR